MFRCVRGGGGGDTLPIHLRALFPFLVRVSSKVKGRGCLIVTFSSGCKEVCKRVGRYPYPCPFVESSG